MQYRKLNELKKLPNNPRIIRDKQFKTLCDSIRDNPKYFEARPVILSNRTGELVIIAGNQRYEAAKSLKLKEVPTFLIEGLDEAKEREIIIRDNISNGEFDWDILANDGWDDLPLADWGVDIPGFNSHELEMTAVGILDLTGGAGKNKQTTYDKLADKKGGVLFNFGDIQQSIPFDVYESFYAKINMRNVKDSLIRELSK